MALYDDAQFFDAYGQMARSRGGLAAAGEWHQLRPLFPPLAGSRMLDLGCGYGWHCRYAAEQGAREVLGIDASRRMLAAAAEKNAHPAVTYRLCAIGDYDYPPESWDLVFSNLALHYIADLDDVFARVFRTLRPGGIFLFNIEHPTFTAGVGQQWLTDEQGRPLCWPVDDYYRPGPRQTVFLGRTVEKYHHTLTQILGGLLACGFCLEAVEEVVPAADTLTQPGMADELRRPMMLLVRARRPQRTPAPGDA